MVDELTPTRIGSDSDWTAIAAGADHTCGVRAGTLYCWGESNHGQVGDGVTHMDTYVLTPTPVAFP
jgi:alpha-tubulin suppressor-like RCC1 family protein